MLRTLLLGIPYLILSLTAFAQNNSTSLFPVNLEHEFPDPAQSFQEVMALIRDHYYDDKITEKDLYWAGIKGMLRHISPPESPELAQIWTPEQYEQIANQLSGVDVSIGIKSTFNAVEGSLTVTEVAGGSPAENKLYPYDRIMRIDGMSLKGKSLNEINGLLNGEEGTSILLTVNRDISILEIQLTRQQYDVKNLEVFTVGSRATAVIKIRKVTLGLADKLKAEMVRFQQSGIRSLIIDLRDNTGGVLNEGLNVANLFLQQNNIIVRTLSRSNDTTPIVSNNIEESNYHILLLVNKNTASAAEVIVGALRDHGKATVIGTGTYGKSVIEETFTLANDYRVKFIKSAMFTPRGISWQSRGFLPDILVEQSAESYQAMNKLEINDQLQQDLYYITAFKLIN